MDRDDVKPRVRPGQHTVGPRSGTSHSRCSPAPTNKNLADGPFWLTEWTIEATSSMSGFGVNRKTFVHSGPFRFWKPDILLTSVGGLPQRVVSLFLATLLRLCAPGLIGRKNES
jgi:hypothetical protein